MTAIAGFFIADNRFTHQLVDDQPNCVALDFTSVPFTLTTTHAKILKGMMSYD